MVSVMLYHDILCVALLMDLFVLYVACSTLFVNCLMKQYAICLGVVAILLLNVMCYVLCWIYRVWSYIECACCVCDPSVNLSVISRGFVKFLYVGSYLVI